MRKIWIAPLGIIGLVACGARGPLDLAPDESLFDASATEDARDLDASSWTDANPSPVEAGKDTSSSPIACAQCVGQSCGKEVGACLQSMGCRTVLQCVAQKCLGGGAPDAKCLAQCAGNDTQAIFQALAVIQCITGKCGNECLALLSGLPGN